MNPMTQPDLHPDADTLNAFVEHVLPDAERARIVAHMAGCGRCRDIVFLARAAAEPEMAPSPARPEPRPGWFSKAFAKWRVALIPAAALASVGAIVLWVQMRPARMEMAKAVPQSVPPASEMASAAMEEAQKAAPAISNDRLVAAAPAGAKATAAARIPGMERKKAAAPALGAVEMDQLAATKEMAVTPEQRRATSAIHLDARSAALARYAPPPEPISPPATLKFTPPQAAPQAQAPQPADAALSAGGKKPATVEAFPSPALVPSPAPPNILAVHGELAPPAAGGPAQVAVQPQPVNGVAMVRLGARAKLPSGLRTVSAAALLNRLVVVDSAGSVFLSQDGGKQWEAVPAQWSGKAVAVQAPKGVHPLILSAGQSQPIDSTAAFGQPAKTAGDEENANAVPSPPPPAGAAAARAPDKPTVMTKAPPPVPALFFKLVTDRHEVWVSADGKLWREQ